MKHRLAKLVLFLLLGAIVNVAVAWGCAALSPLDRDADRLDHTVTLRGLSRFELKRQLFEEHPDAGGLVWNGFGYRLSELGLGHKVADMYFGGPMYAVVESGWPLHCLEARGSWNLGPVATPGLRIDRKLILGTGPYPLVLDQRTIPLRPIWSGFAVNTLFYSALLWLPFGPFAIRRIVRRQHGHCIKCGYDLRGEFSAGCPECGWRREDVS